jgi:pantoate--beta-alanine ligase
MGALHSGHMALVDAARARGARAAITIFVNPTQFGPNEDFARYPRPIERDLELANAHGAELAFVPSLEEMYPPGEQTRVSVAKLVDVLCGPKRPNHFDGVATVVTKLFNVSGPCVAIFGRKDYQQLQVIRRMVRDLLLPVEVVGHPIVREADGLALSSRNMYLDAAERAAAPQIARALSAAVRGFAAGERRAAALRAPVEAALVAAGFRVDYVELVGESELEPIADEVTLAGSALLAVAAFLGRTRLLDNVVLGQDPAPVPEEEHG